MRTTSDYEPFQNAELCADPHIRISAHARGGRQGTPRHLCAHAFMRINA